MFELARRVTHKPQCSTPARPCQRGCITNVELLVERDEAMSDLVNEAVTMLNAKLGGAGWDGGTAKFVFKGEGAMILDATGARAGDDDADVTLTATPETFKALFDGDLNPTAAFMTGRLSVDGNMGLALKLSSVLG